MPRVLAGGRRRQRPCPLRSPVRPLLCQVLHTPPALSEIRSVDEAVVIGAALSLSSSAFVLQARVGRGEAPAAQRCLPGKLVCHQALDAWRNPSPTPPSFSRSVGSWISDLARPR